jgi:hypothetical protein
VIREFMKHVYGMVDNPPPLSDLNTVLKELTRLLDKKVK